MMKLLIAPAIALIAFSATAKAQDHDSKSDTPILGKTIVYCPEHIDLTFKLPLTRATVDIDDTGWVQTGDHLTIQGSFEPTLSPPTVSIHNPSTGDGDTRMICIYTVNIPALKSKTDQTLNISYGLGHRYSDGQCTIDQKNHSVSCK
jgi:hypothetical protein